ncbi:hypothetical protein GCM10025868_24170 [Angustibacter aerolatus]|uniref:Uncharacterized protein n=1 Tax=Angustibacter aerolatus TaxID=1162965 RepID=A0ABQ6JJW7_9ACTN|nr:hypothetical protein GCM10025868_24170 [Angustibacter aerolatus]
MPSAADARSAASIARAPRSATSSSELTEQPQARLMRYLPVPTEWSSESSTSSTGVPIRSPQASGPMG